MRNYWKLFILFLMLGTHLKAQQTQVEVSSDTNAILIGAQVKLDLSYTFPLDHLGLFPVFKDTISTPLEIVSASPIDTLINRDNGIQTLSQQLIITSFDTGYHIIPPLPFGLMKQGDTSFQVIQSQALLLNVFTVEVDTTKDIKPITGPVGEPYTLGEILPWITLVLVIGLIIFILFYFIKIKKKDKSLFKKKEKPALPAHEQALLDIQNLRLKKLWQQGHLKEYHTDLIDIIRVYIESRYGIQAAEMVSDEIVDSLKTENINLEVMNKLKASLALADLVKFAKSGASALENDTSLNNCTDFVNETKVLKAPIEDETNLVEGKESPYVS